MALGAVISLLGYVFFVYTGIAHSARVFVAMTLRADGSGSTLQRITHGLQVHLCGSAGMTCGALQGIALGRHLMCDELVCLGLYRLELIRGVVAHIDEAL